VDQVLGRRQKMSHAALVRSELGEGMGHLWHAAGHAADGMGEAAGPAWRMARQRMMATSGGRRMHTASRTMAGYGRGWQAMMSKVIMKRESRSGRRRVGMLVGLLAAGVAAGAAAAMAARRRNRMAWEEYETHGHAYTGDHAEPLAEPAYDPMGTA
jgi:hypothetical protein